MCLGITEGWKDEQSTLYYWYAVKNVFFFEKMLWFFISWLYQGWKYRSCSSNILFTSICIQWTDFLTFIKHMVDHCRQKQNDEHNNKCGVWTEDNLVCKKVHLLYFHHWFEHTRNIPGNIIWWPLILPVYEKISFDKI